MERPFDEKLIDESEIARALQVLSSKLVRINFYLNNKDYQLSGLLYQFDESRRAYDLKKIRPDKTFINVKETHVVTAYCAYPAGLMQFQTNLTAELQGEDKVLSIQVPEQIEIIQQRRAFRVRPQSACFSLCFDEYHELTGQVVDISELGISIQIDGDYAQLYHDNDMLDACHVQLSDDEYIDCQLKIKRIDYEQDQGVTNIAGIFEGLDKGQCTSLRKYVMDCQRLEVRKGKTLNAQ